MDTIEQLAETQKELAALKARVLEALDSIESAILDGERCDTSKIGAIAYIVAELHQNLKESNTNEANT